VFDSGRLSKIVIQRADSSAETRLSPVFHAVVDRSRGTRPLHVSHHPLRNPFVLTPPIVPHLSPSARVKMTVQGLDSSHRRNESRFAGRKKFESDEGVGAGLATIESASEICGRKFFSVEESESIVLALKRRAPDLRPAWLPSLSLGRAARACLFEPLKFRQ
jgi:hypothetical protein